MKMHEIVEEIGKIVRVVKMEDCVPSLTFMKSVGVRISLFFV